MSMKYQIFGIHAVYAALQHTPTRIKALYVTKERRDKRINDLIAVARQQAITVQPLELNKLDKQDATQGVMAEVQAPQILSEADIPGLLHAYSAQSIAPLLLILDGVTDPHNLGACLRTADAVGVQAIICPKDKSASINNVVEKVASGAASTIPLIQVTNLARVMKQLQAEGVWLFGTSDQAQHSIYDTDLRGPMALVVGAEGAGLRRLTTEHCDHLVSIPMQGYVSSLNVAVATAVCLYEAHRQRAKSTR